MDDIVTRLRRRMPADRIAVDAGLSRDLTDALAEIERLRAYQDETAKIWIRLTESQEEENERLRAALIQFANDENCDAAFEQGRGR